MVRQKRKPGKSKWAIETAVTDIAATSMDSNFLGFQSWLVVGRQLFVRSILNQHCPTVTWRWVSIQVNLPMLIV